MIHHLMVFTILQVRLAWLNYDHEDSISEFYDHSCITGSVECGAANLFST